jgi:Fe-S-cluster containining protein
MKTLPLPQVAELLRKYGIVEEVRRILVPYPEMDADIEEVLKEEKVLLLTPFDIVFLFEHQNGLCAKCGKCCRTNSPIYVTPLDLARIAEHLRVPYSELKRRLKLIPLRNGAYHMVGKPCPFLKGNLCSIYEARPEVCRLYPAVAIYDSAVTGRPIELDFECAVIRTLYVSKIAAAVVRKRLEREEFEGAEAVTLSSRSVHEDIAQHLHRQLLLGAP